MNAQRHVIKRQVIELEVRGAAQAQTLQDEVSRIYRQRIIPLIDRRCSEYSPPGRLYRIDSLDLDLGMLDPQRLEEDLVEKMDAALQRALAAQIDAQEQPRPGGSPQAQSQLELFALFARTGSLPWWADISQPGILAENMAALLSETPEALRRLVRELLRETHVRRRLARQYDDDQLTALAGLLVPQYETALRRDVRELYTLIHAANGIAAGASLSRTRNILWEALLQTAGAGSGSAASLAAFYQDVLRRVAAELGGTGDKLVATVGPAANAELARLLEKQTGDGKPLPAPRALSRRLAQLQPAGGALSALWSELRTLVARFPTRQQELWLSAVNEAGARPSLQTVAGRMLGLFRPEAVEDEPPAQDRARLAQVLRTILNAEKVVPAAAAHPPAPEDNDEAPLDLHFSETDALPVGNSGLVILWPFLGHFFDRLGLLDEDRRFKDLTSRQRAAGLLEIVATQDPGPAPEYRLPLNKLLCGLELEQVFDFDPPLGEAEAQECAGLLEAVIAQAPILHEMSPDGFRGSFLLRPGLLSAGEGFWLLRVERQTYDIVLDRFPWSWEWVKLSWMDAPLRVEW